MWGRAKRVYLDHAGATPVRTSSLRAHARALGHMGNPGALHAEGVEAASALKKARAGVAHSLGCTAGEIIFTSGGTEGNNIALLGAANELEKKGALSGSHFLISSIEHPSILEAARTLVARGVRVSFIAPDAQGLITPERVASLLETGTAFVSIGWANGEIGVVQPLEKIARAIRSHEAERKPGTHTPVVFHTDMGQAPLYRSPQVHTLGVDIATIDGGKLGSVRGIGALFLKRGTPLSPISFGGSQERGVRPGTENPALAAGLAAALAEADGERAQEAQRLLSLRAHLIALLRKEGSLEGFTVNGTARTQLPSILNISIPGVDNEYLTLALDAKGIAVATKSACREGEAESHVIAALAGEGEAWRATNALRISFGNGTKAGDCIRFACTLGAIVRSMRAAQGV